MRTLASLLALLLASAGPIYAQENTRHVDFDVEPLAYTFGGAGGHVALQNGACKYEVEVFGLETPKSVHGNHGFTVKPFGLELHSSTSSAMMWGLLRGSRSTSCTT